MDTHAPQSVLPPPAARLNPAIPPEDAARWMATLRKHPVGVPEQRLVTWLNRIYDREPERVDWHIKRSWACTATRVGVLVADYENGDTPFMTTARDVISDMLLLTTPFGATHHMRRGIQMEEMIRQMFLSGEWLEEFGISQDTPIVRITDEVLTHGALDHWQDAGVVYSGSPDDIVMIGNGRFVVDYKAPTRPHNAEDEQQYALQLDHNRYGIEQQTGLTLTGGLLVQLDWQNWKLVVTANDPAQYPTNIRRIQEACSNYWFNNVMKDTLPPLIEKTAHKIDDSSEKGRELRDLGYKFFVSKILVDKMTTEVNAAKAEIQAMINDPQLSGLPPVVLAGPDGGLKISLKPDFDEDAIREAAMAREIELPTTEVQTNKPNLGKIKDLLALAGHEVPYVVEKTIDYERAVALLKESGLPHSFRTYATRFDFDKKKDSKGADAVVAARQTIGTALTPVYGGLLRRIGSAYNSSSAQPEVLVNEPTPPAVVQAPTGVVDTPATQRSGTPSKRRA